MDIATADAAAPVRQDWTRIPIDHLPAEWTMPLRAPLGYKGGDQLTELKLREPRVSEIVAAGSLTGAEFGLHLLSRTSGIEPRLVEKLGARDMEWAADYLLAFLNTDRTGRHSFRRLAVDDVPPTWDCALRSGGKLTLCEPSAAALRDAGKQDLLQAGLHLLASVTGLAQEELGQMAARDYDDCADYLLSFTRAGRRTLTAG